MVRVQESFLSILPVRFRSNVQDQDSGLKNLYIFILSGSDEAIFIIRHKGLGSGELFFSIDLFEFEQGLGSGEYFFSFQCSVEFLIHSFCEN